MLVTCTHCSPRPIYAALAKAAGMQPVPQERAAAKKARVAMRRALLGAFGDLADQAADHLVEALGLSDVEKARKPGGDPSALDLIAQQVGDALASLVLDWSGLVDPLAEVFATLMVDAGGRALDQVGAKEDDKAQQLMRVKATTWADDRAAEMVGMRKAADGTLVPNPNAQWRIDESTRDMIRSTVEQALEDGWSAGKLRKELRQSAGFDRARADMISRTDLARADMQGQLIGWEASGLVTEVEWLTAEDCCDECQALDGDKVPLGQDFPGGVTAPPLHPNCRCTALPVLGPEST